MKRFVLLLLTVSVITVSQAQSKSGHVSGAIKDAGQKGIASATVALLNATDSSVAKLAISDKQGNFEFEKIADGKYLVSITATGQTKAYSQLFELSSVNNRIDLGDFEMVQLTTELGGVTVNSRRPLVENKIDRTVVNVESSITNNGLTALDILEKSPGVLVDNNGAISLKGKAGVIILIDNKQTYLGGQDLVNYLRSLTSAQLDQIEIMSQPPAKYDASGNSGVINIKTKKGTQTGYNGSISLSYIQANYPKSPNSINMNYRKGKTNIFGQYSYAYWEGFSKIYIDRFFGKVSDAEFQSLFDQFSFQRFRSNTHSFRLGVDYYATKKTTLGISVNGTLNRNSSLGETKSDFLDNNYELLSYNTARTTSSGPWRNFATNLNFKTVLNKGREISGDIDGIYYYNKTIQNSDNYNYNADGSLRPPISPDQPNPFLLRGQLPGTIHIVTAKVDYLHPLKKGARLEAGVKSGYVRNDNNAQYSYYENGDVHDDLIFDEKRSNHFIYQENVNAAYVNYSRQIDKWGVQFGLRMENTNIRGNQLRAQAGVKAKFDSSYIQLFPTSYLSYALNKTNTFTLSYGRRIERPGYQDMNPFVYFLDQYTYRQGNPFLLPQTSNNIELSYNYKGQLNVSVNYTKTKDIINDILEQNDTSFVTFQIKRNIASRRNIGLSINYNKALKKWWTVSLFGNLFNNYFEGYINKVKLNVDVTTYFVNMSNQFRFGKGWGAEVSGFYRNRVLASGMIVGEPMGVLSFGASKQILKNKGSIRLNLTDPFWFQYFRGFSKFDNVDMTIMNRWDNRRATITFTYRFSKGEAQPQQRRRTSASQDEQNRLGGGNQNQ